MHEKLKTMIELQHRSPDYTITTFLPEPKDIYAVKVQMVREDGYEFFMEGSLVFIERDGEATCIRKEKLDITATMKELIDDAFKHVFNEDLLHITGDHHHG